jgi:hypothetical protein
VLGGELVFEVYATSRRIVMRLRLLLLALVIIIAPIPRDARAQDTASRIEVLALALEAVRGEKPGRVIVHLSPPSLQSSTVSRSEIMQAAKRIRFTTTDDPKGIAGSPVQTYLRLEHAIIGANEASILVAVAERKPDGSYIKERTDKAILTRVDGRWHVKVLPYFALR